MTTFTSASHGDQWADPNLSVDTFAPSGLNIDQWLDAVVTSGCKYAMLTTKHHDGFKLWASTQHVGSNPVYGISATSWYAANGNPDVVGLFAQKCRDRGLNVVLYFSIWDRTYEIQSSTTAATGAAAYTAMIEAELSELLTNYGAITAIWTDGWGWSQTPTTPGAWPGGVGNYTNIPYTTIYNYIKAIQPNCLLIENGHAHPATHSDIEVYEVTGGDGFPAANNTRPSDTMDTIRWDIDWFFTASDYQDGSNAMSPRAIAGYVAQMNAASSTYTLDFTPTRAGVVPTEQNAAFSTFRGEYAHSNLAAGKTVTSSSVRPGGYTPAVLTDGVLTNDRSLYLQTFFSANTDAAPWIEIDLGAAANVGGVAIFNLTNSNNGGELRDLTVTLYDAAHSLTYTSSTLNAGNAAYSGSYLLGPSQVTLDNINTSGRYVRVTRGNTGTNSGNRFSIDEVMVFGAFSGQQRGTVSMRGKAVMR